MSGQHPPNIPIQGVGGTGPPPTDPAAARTPTPATYGAPMGHNAQHTPPQQYAYGYQMHMPMLPAHQTNQPMHMGYYTTYPVAQPPLGTQMDPVSDENEDQRSPTLGLGAGRKRARQEDTPGGRQRFRTTTQNHRPTLTPFDDDIFNTQSPEMTQNRINSAIDRLENLINNAEIETINQSAKDRIQALASRLNGNEMNKTLTKISEVLEKLTRPQENTQPTDIDETSDQTQTRTFAKVVKDKRITTRIPTAQEPPSLRHHPRRVIVIMEEKPPIHARTPANKIVTNINTRLQELGATFKVQSTSWTDAGNLVIIVPTPEDAAKMVTEFEGWAKSLPSKASHAQLDTKTHQVVIQRAYLRNDQDKLMTPTEIERELYESNGIDKETLALTPRLLVARNARENAEHGPIMVAFRNEVDAIQYKTFGLFFRGDHCYVRDYIETKRINRCLNCHELTHPTRSCSRRPRCVHCTSTEHTSEEHPKHECKECEKDTQCPHNNFTCANCNGNHAANDPGCPVWLKRRGLLKDAGPSQQKQPPGGRNRHAANLADLIKPAKESQKQRNGKTTAPTAQETDMNNENSDITMEPNA